VPDVAPEPPAAAGRAPLIVAHRGGESPEALRASLATGADLVEVDVHFFRGGLELGHARPIGPLLVDGLRIRRHRGRRSLADVVAALGGEDRLMLDLKGSTAQVGAEVAQVIAQHAPGSALTVCTQVWSMLDPLEPPVRRVLSAGTRRELAALRARLARPARPGESAFGVSVRLKLLTPEVVAELAARVERVMAWTITTPGQLARARSLGVGALIGPDVALLRSP
jgi:hypothetical protein